ncbi:uncharacterized protein LOC141643259 isoform X1 [Silene latifolia]|uniref:uncharacterized protein LOC141643259 isoform X1 n=1 Tax=Silene latifolia TaxID=37657 RepID=UPI003D7776BA
MEGKEEVRFKVNLSDEGSSKLAHRLTLTLKDYMGDFVDDTLVKYVIVLLGNGRSKEEIKEDLDVFLGDSSDSFVNWLWDHLASDLDQYVQPQMPSTHEAAKTEPVVVEHNGETDSQQPSVDSVKGKLKSNRSRHNRDWKGIMSNESLPPLRSSITTDAPKEEKVHSKVVRTRRPASPEHPVNRKRSRADERARPKREMSQSTIAAPRRLLQFAVRDAVGTRPSNPMSEPSRKRLRSVVSTPTGNLSDEVEPQKLQTVARALNPVNTAIRAVAEAAEDVKRVKSGNVFDRLSRGVDDRSELVSEFRASAAQGIDYEDIRQNSREAYVRKRDYGETCNVNASLINSNTCLASDSASDNDGYGNVTGHRVMDISETGTSRCNKADDSLMVQYHVSENTDELTDWPRMNGQDSAVSAGTKHKVVNISVNVNTWKPSHYQSTSEKIQTGSQKLRAENNNGPTNSIARRMKDSNNPATVIENGNTAAESQKELQTASGPGSNSSGHPLEDADSRTIFVNNVHFAATTDTLSRHFNKFGEVLKVIVSTDVATGHPKGSAYVEFMKKEAADNALTLDGTSFMSRIIKVMKKSSSQQEVSPITTWPRITRGSSVAVARYSQAPFPRVFPGAYRGRSAVKPGMRSMQWKRDSPQTSTNSVVPVSGGTINTNTSAPSASRGLTYVRAVSKTDGNAAGA